MRMCSVTLGLALAWFASVGTALAQDTRSQASARPSTQDRQVEANRPVPNLKLEVPAQLGSALLVSGVSTLGSLALLRLDQRPVVTGLLLTTPMFATAAMVDGVGRWHGDQGRYRGGLLGALGGTALGAAIGGSIVIGYAFGEVVEPRELSHTQLVLMLGVPTAVCSAALSVVGYNASARRQRRHLAAKPLAMDGGVGPLREGGAMFSLRGRF
jgi:hypothetical protein